MQTTAPDAGTGSRSGEQPDCRGPSRGAAPQIKTIPKDLLPSLAETQQDFAGFNVNPATSLRPVRSEQRDRIRICTLGDSERKEAAGPLRGLTRPHVAARIQQIAVDAHWRLVVLTSCFCPAELVTVSNPTPTALPGPPNTLCDEFHSWAVDHINAMRPDLVVVAQSSLYDSPQTGKARGDLFSRAVWGNGLVHLLQAIHVPPTHKIYLGDIPELPTRSAYLPVGPSRRCASLRRRRRDNYRLCRNGTEGRGTVDANSSTRRPGSARPSARLS